MTNVILTAVLLDADNHRAQAICSWDLGDGQRFVHLNQHKKAYGGHKVLEHDVFVVAANFIDAASLKRSLMAFDWEDDIGRDSVRLFIAGQEDDAFYMLTLDDVQRLDRVR